MIIQSEKQLREIYDNPKGRAKEKVLTSLEKHSRHFINTSPFLVLSTINNKGQMDNSPRGGEKGFVKILNDNEILIPDYKGNNRIDSLINITENSSVGILFLIPGIDETLRVNGKAEIRLDEIYINEFQSNDKLPISCLKVKIEEVFLHCAKAFMRSQLWQISSQINPEEFPSIGQMIKDQLKHDDPVESREAMKKRYLSNM